MIFFFFFCSASIQGLMPRFCGESLTVIGPSQQYDDTFSVIEAVLSSSQESLPETATKFTTQNPLTKTNCAAPLGNFPEGGIMPGATLW
jgi:hypothetical protein